MVASIPCDSKQNLPDVLFTRKTCMVSLMETPGRRIQRMRLQQEWSLATLGKKIAAATGRTRPYSGEAIRKYEIGENELRPDVVRGLALVFGKPESYILFGDHATQKRSQPAKEPDATTYIDLGVLYPEEIALLKAYRNVSPENRMAVQNFLHAIERRVVRNLVQEFEFQGREKRTKSTDH